MRRFLFFIVPWIGWTLGCSSPQPPADRVTLATQSRDHNVVVVLLDAAVATHFSFLGYERKTTPHLDALAGESIVFEQAYAQASATPMSVLSLFTGRYPMPEKAPELMGEIGPVLPPLPTTLAALLGARFEDRVGISANSWISSDFGYDYGFTDFYEVFEDRNEAPRPGTARRVADQFITWLDDAEPDRFFAYVHFYEPHAPYTPPENYRRFDVESLGHVDGSTAGLKPYRTTIPSDEIVRNVRALYDANLAYVDSQVQRVVDALVDAGQWENTLFVLVSDHGEAFWEHGVRGHGLHAYEEFIRVPLLVRVPSLRTAPRRVPTPVELIDLLPTLVEFLDLPVEQPTFAGESLVPHMVGPPLSQADDVFSRNHEYHDLEIAMRRGPHKMIQNIAAGSLALYDLHADPGETRNLYDPDDPQSENFQTARAMALDLQKWIDATTASWSRLGLEIAAPDSLDQETIDRLRSMGYLN